VFSKLINLHKKATHTFRAMTKVQIMTSEIHLAQYA